MATYQDKNENLEAGEIQIRIEATLELIDQIDRQIEFGIPRDCPMAVGRSLGARNLPYEVWSSIEIGRINRMLGRIEAEASKQDLGRESRLTNGMVGYVLRTARAVGVRT